MGNTFFQTNKYLARRRIRAIFLEEKTSVVSQAIKSIFKKLRICSLGPKFSSPNPFFANNSRQDGDRDAETVLHDLARQDASEDMHIDLLGWWPGLDLNLSWSGLRSNFEIDLSRSRITYSKPARRGKHDGVIFIVASLISKKMLIKTISVKKRYFLIWWPLIKNTWP